jgi:hypothetical protein
LGWRGEYRERGLRPLSNYLPLLNKMKPGEMLDLFERGITGVSIEISSIADRPRQSKSIDFKAGRW